MILISDTHMKEELEREKMKRKKGKFEGGWGGGRTLFLLSLFTSLFPLFKFFSPFSFHLFVQYGTKNLR